MHARLECCDRKGKWAYGNRKASQHFLIRTLAKRNGMTNYAVVSLLVSIGMQLLSRCGNDFEAARQASIMSDIKLMIPPEVSEDIAEMKAVVRRMLAHQLQTLWVASLHAES